MQEKDFVAQSPFFVVPMSSAPKVATYTPPFRGPWAAETFLVKEDCSPFSDKALIIIGMNNVRSITDDQNVSNTLTQEFKSLNQSKQIIPIDHLEQILFLVERKI